MEFEKNTNWKTTEDVARSLPYFMKLPIIGFKNPNYHCFVTTNHFRMILDKSIVAGIAGTKAVSYGVNKVAKTALTAIGGRALEEVVGFSNNSNDGASVTNKSNLIDFISSMFGVTLPYWKYVFTVVLPRLNFALSVQFHGVQFVMGLRGLTMLKDERINSFSPESEVHHIITPYEMLLYDHIVRAASDGEVVEIINDYEDRVKHHLTLDFASFKPDDFLGNIVKIKNSLGVYSIYACMKKNSNMVKVGDRVKAGQAIGRVGWSGEFPYPVCFFAIETLGFKLPIAGNMRVPLTTRKQLWDLHYSCKLLDDFDNERDLHFFESVHPGKVKYELTTGKLYDCSFVKQYPTIHLE